MHMESRCYWWTYLQGSNGDTDIQNRLVDTVEEGRTNWEQHGNIHITICKTDSQWACAVWHRELNPLLRNYLEGQDGAGNRGSRERKHMCTCSWFMIYGRNQYNIVKQLSPQPKFLKNNKICLPMQGTKVLSLVGELRSHMPWGN